MFNPYEYFKGKNVLLIGNGEKISQINYSKYNSIVRMNLGVQDKPCDVWINNLVHEGHSKLNLGNRNLLRSLPTLILLS